GSERDEAVNALKEYKKLNGDTELNKHLENVSGTFRDFLLEQLSDETKPPSSPKASNHSMSERLKLFRSKLGPKDATATPSSANGIDASKPISTESTTATAKTSANAFRERLAAANEKRAVSTSLTSSGSGQPVSAAPPSSPGSRAAALRARLQAVKMQSALPDGGK
ncbi:MAG: hypothetical protein SGILL_007628, partial [Bacillariaceae sp.]